MSMYAYVNFLISILILVGMNLVLLEDTRKSNLISTVVMCKVVRSEHSCNLGGAGEGQMPLQYFFYLKIPYFLLATELRWGK